MVSSPIVALALTTLGTGANAQTCTMPDLVAAAVPDTVPAARPYATIRDTGIPFAEVDLGIGHLRPTESTWAWDWLDRVKLPLSPSPGATPWGWIAGGWIVDASGGHVAPFARSGLVETGYEDATVIVFERTDDGWLRIRFAADSLWSSDDGAREVTGEEGGRINLSPREGGTAWIPQCALRADDLELQVEPWGELFLSDRISPLFFRSDVRHVLRLEARSDSRRLAVIEGDYHLEPLEIEGDWMRVTLKQPSDYCADDLEPVVTTGWIEWRSPEKGPSLWYHSRGC